MFRRISFKNIFKILVLWAYWSCSPKQENKTNSAEKKPEINSVDSVANNQFDTAHIAGNRLLIPGKRIGLTALQEKAEVVRARLGKPDQSDAAMGKALAT